MEQITLSTQDLEKIKKIVDEFGVQYFEIIKDKHNALEYTLDITFWTYVKGNHVQVTVPLITPLDW
jgi:hypothetical protein